MAYDVIHKNSTVAGTPPTAAEVHLGEIAINAADAELYTKDTDGNIQAFISQFAPAGANAARRAVQSKLRDVVSVKDFGATGDGVTDDAAAIQAAINAASCVYFPAGTYMLESTLTISGSGRKLYGDGAASILTSDVLTRLCLLGTLSDSIIQDLSFSVATVKSTEDFLGIVYNDNTALANVTLRHCAFTCSSANVNAIKFINESTPVCENVKIQNCKFENIGRMAIEAQNHNYDGTYRYKYITVEDCSFKNIGLVSTGFGVSLSGLGSFCNISNNIFDGVTIGIELVGASDTTISSNKFKSFNSGGRPLSFSGNLLMRRNVVESNTTEAASPGSTLISNQQDLKLTNNTWNHAAGYLYMFDIADSLITANKITSAGNYATFIEGTSINNTFVNCILSNEDSANNFSTFRAYNPNVSNTLLIGCRISQGAGGVLVDAVNGAEQPLLALARTGSSSIIYSTTNQRSGINYQVGLSKTAGTGANSTSVTIDLGSTSSWIPSYISAKVVSTRNDGGGAGITCNNVGVRHVNGQSPIVFSNDAVTAASLTLTTATSGTSVTLTATHSSTSGPNLLFRWDLTVLSATLPVFS